MKSLLFSMFMLAATAAAQQTINIGTVTVPNEVASQVETWRLTQLKPQTATITLSNSINASATSITVSDATNIAVSDQLVIDSEAITVSAKVGNVLTVARGMTITSGAAHTAGVSVGVCKFATSVVLLKQIMKDGVTQILTQSPSATIQGLITTRDAAQANISAFLGTVLQ